MLLQRLADRRAVSRCHLHQPRSSRKSGGSSGIGRYQARLLAGLAVLLGVVAATLGADRTLAAGAAVAAPCRALTLAANRTTDAGAALQACLDATPAGGRIELAPGHYRLATPVRLDHPLTLTTRGSTPDAPACSTNERRCALLHLAIAAAPPSAGAVMPFEVASDRARIDRLVFVGTRRSDPALSARRCALDTERPMGGGLRVNGNAITITRSVFRDMACYSALEYGRGAGAVIRDNDFTTNGTHTAELRWADGLTIHDVTGFRVTDNRFRDNTDVQLILGGCVGCTITNNRFAHGGTAAGGSFAELMLQAWPNATSGDFTGTRTAGNRIDCGARRRCGFGLMIGSAPWYAAPAFGGTVTRNRVRGAMLALNVDSLTGAMTIADNDLATASGTWPSACGPQRTAPAAANVSPASRGFLAPATIPAGATARRYCILNHPGPAPAPPPPAAAP